MSKDQEVFFRDVKGRRYEAQYGRESRPDCALGWGGPCSRGLPQPEPWVHPLRRNQEGKEDGESAPPRRVGKCGGAVWSMRSAWGRVR